MNNLDDNKKRNLKIKIFYLILFVCIVSGITFALQLSSLSLAIDTAVVKIDEEVYGENSLDTSNLDLIPMLDSEVDTNKDNVLKIDFVVGGSKDNTREDIIYDIALVDLNVECDLLSEYVKWKLVKNGEVLSNGSLSYTFDTIKNNRFVLTEIQQDLPEYNDKQEGYDKYSFYLWLSDPCQNSLEVCYNNNDTSDTSSLMGKVLTGAIEVELYTDSKKALVRTPSEEVYSRMCGDWVTLEATWLGEESVEARTEIDKNLVKVVAVYEDGTTNELESSEWTFGSPVKGNKFPNVNGEYQIPVEYTEGGIKKTGTFSVNIYGAVAEIVRLEASVRDIYQAVELGDELGSYMYDVTAIYNDGSTKELSRAKIVKSPNYPNGYPYTSGSYQRVARLDFPSDVYAVKIKFDKESSLYYNRDKITINKGVSMPTIYAGEVSQSNIAGYEMMVEFGEIPILSYSALSFELKSYYEEHNSSFAAVVIPLDVNGNEISEFVISSTTAPSKEGTFDVNISLNPDLYDEEVSTTVTMEAKNS